MQIMLDVSADDDGRVSGTAQLVSGTAQLVSGTAQLVSGTAPLASDTAPALRFDGALELMATIDELCRPDGRHSEDPRTT